MSCKSRKRKAAARKLRAYHRNNMAAYRAKRLPGETAREQLVRTVNEIHDHPERFIAPATFKFISVGYEQR